MEKILPWKGDENCSYLELRLEVCTGPGLARPARFSNEPGRQMKGDFFNRLGRVGKKKNEFGPGRAEPGPKKSACA